MTEDSDLREGDPSIGIVIPTPTKSSWREEPDPIRRAAERERLTQQLRQLSTYRTCSAPQDQSSADSTRGGRRQAVASAALASKARPAARRERNDLTAHHASPRISSDRATARACDARSAHQAASRSSATRSL